MSCLMRRMSTLLALPALALICAPLPAQTAAPIGIGFLPIDGGPFYGDVEMRAADHQLIRQNGVAEVVKGADGKPTFVMRTIDKGAALYPPPSDECKLQ